MTAVFYSDDLVALYHGDWRDSEAWHGADAIVTDPPYGETSLAWDRWPSDWPGIVADLSTAPQLWCFGSMRMFLDQRDDFADWKFGQDIVWRKPRGRSFMRDRFNRSHEYAIHWYRGPWGDLYRDTPRTIHTGAPVISTRRGQVDDGTKVKPLAAGAYNDDGTRLMLTVIDGDAGDPRKLLHPNQKPENIVEAMIGYSVPPGGLVADLFAGSGTTLAVARQMGRRAVGFEVNEAYCEKAAARLSQPTLELFAGGHK